MSRRWRKAAAICKSILAPARSAWASQTSAEKSHSRRQLRRTMHASITPHLTRYPHLWVRVPAEFGLLFAVARAPNLRPTPALASTQRVLACSARVYNCDATRVASLMRKRAPTQRSPDRKIRFVIVSKAKDLLPARRKTPRSKTDPYGSSAPMANLPAVGRAFPSKSVCRSGIRVPAFLAGLRGDR